MKIKFILLVFLLLGMVLPSQLVAQNANPDLTRMRLLLAQIEDCNADIKIAEADIKAYEDYDSEASLELYLQVRKNMKIATKCKAASQKEYDALKADYEGWFKASTSAMVVGSQRVTPRWLQQYFGAMFGYYGVVFVRFNAIKEPEH